MVTIKDIVNEFKAKHIGKYVDVDHVFGSQCVDLIKLYCGYFGITGLSGNAYDYKKNAILKQYCTWVKPDKLEVGDIICWGKDRYTYGHVAVYLGNGQTLSINGSIDKDGDGKGDGLVEVEPLKTKGLEGGWRFKSLSENKMVEVIKKINPKYKLPTSAPVKQLSDKEQVEQLIEDKKLSVLDAKIKDTERVGKQKARNSGIFGGLGLTLFSYLESNFDWFVQIEDALGHDMVMNFFAFVLPTMAYWGLNQFAFKLFKENSQFVSLLTPFLLGVGNKKYLESKNTTLKDIQKLEDVLRLMK